MFQAFRIYDFIKDDENSDFYSVFVDRLYPRGIKKEVFSSFLWLKAVTPSSELRAWFFTKTGKPDLRNLSSNLWQNLRTKRR